jgi:hypothetical protein
MAQRGRGCLEVKKSLNPFMQTGSSEIGFRATQIEWNRPAVNVEEMVLPPAQGEDNGNFMFLYTRESDTIGSQLAKPQHSLAYEPKSKGDLLREKRDRLRALKATCVKKDLEPQDLEDAKTANVVACINSWNPCIKEEDPRYTTANNEIGIKKPTMATFVRERCFRSQAFSNGFLNSKAENSSLNTGLTKSTVHPKLDPQFI